MRLSGRHIGQLLVLILLFPLLFTIVSNGQRIQKISTPTRIKFEPRGSVAISGQNIAIDGAIFGNNWTDCPWVNGSGTAVDPYIIQDLILSLTFDQKEPLIDIRNTDAYFIVDNCTIPEEIGYPSVTLINLWNVKNGLLENNLCPQINLTHASEVTVRKNSAPTIRLTSSRFVTVTGNVGFIRLNEASNNTISENQCCGGANQGIGLSNSHSNHISKNNCSDVQVTHNYYDTGTGILISESDFNVLTENTCNQNGYAGISLHGADNNTVCYNNCSYNGKTGIRILGSDRNFIANNILVGNKEECISYIGGYGEGNIDLDNQCGTPWSMEWSSYIPVVLIAVGIFVGFVFFKTRKPSDKMSQWKRARVDRAQKILQMADSIDMSVLNDAMDLSDRQIRKLAKKSSLEIEGRVLVKISENHTFVENLRKEFESWG